MTEDIFSIIIPCLNEEKRIVNVLSAIRKFKLGSCKVEIILVDNGSIDKTVELAQPYCDKIIIKEKVSIAALRNIGAFQSSGDYLGFIDADCEPARSWLLVALNTLKKDKSVGIVGSFYGIPERPNWIEKAWYDRRRHFGKKNVRFLPGGNIAVRKLDFSIIGGFSDILITGEDFDLCQRFINNGYYIKNIPEMKSIHYGNYKNLFDVLRREAWYGQGMINSIKKNIFSWVFLITNIITVGIILFIFNILLLQSITIFFLSVFVIFLPITAYAVKACIESKSVAKFLQYFLIYVFYFAGRVKSLYNIYTLQTNHHKK